MVRSTRMRVGFVGVGSIVGDLVDAIMTGPHADLVDIALSPRSVVRSAELAQRYPNVGVLPGNQEVVDASDLVVVGVLPGQVREVCSALSFREGQIVVSLAAGWTPALLESLVAPASVCQLLPLPMVSLHVGPLVLFPAVDEVRWLLTGCGEVIEVSSEADLVALTASTATMSTVIELHVRVVDWLIGKGLTPTAAHAYVSAMFQGLGAEFADAPAADLKHLTLQHETVGGLNELVRETLSARGIFDGLTSLLDRIQRGRADSAG